MIAFFLAAPVHGGERGLMVVSTHGALSAGLKRYDFWLSRHTECAYYFAPVPAHAVRELLSVCRGTLSVRATLL
ncbi:MAG: hypothetical protein Aurels2KO_53020 [Aureliella sp.]